GSAEGEQHRGLGAHPGGVEQRIAALEPAEPRLGRGAGRVAVPRVEELARLPVRVVRPDRRAVDVLHPARLARYAPPMADTARRIHETTAEKLAWLEEQRVGSQHTGS